MLHAYTFNYVAKQEIRLLRKNHFNPSTFPSFKNLQTIIFSIRILHIIRGYKDVKLKLLNFLALLYAPLTYISYDSILFVINFWFKTDLHSTFFEREI